MRDHAPLGKEVFNNFTIILVLRPTIEEDELIKDSFHRKT